MITSGQPLQPSASRLHELLTQFQQRHPTGGLVADLLTIYDSQYVVRAYVQIGGVVLATGLASADTIELSEDRAKTRALETLGLGAYGFQTSLPIDLSSSHLPTAASAKPILGDSESSGFTEEQAAEITPPSVPVFETPKPSIDRDIPVYSLPDDLPPLPELPLAALDDFDSPTVPEPDEAPDLTVSSASFPVPDDNTLSFDFTAPASSPAKKSAPVAPASPVAIEETHDFSDIIVKIDVEMRRLGWNATQGREHLKQTYGKRSRQQLSHAELLDFLHYLELQSAAARSSA